MPTFLRPQTQFLRPPRLKEVLTFGADLPQAERVICKTVRECLASPEFKGFEFFSS